MFSNFSLSEVHPSETTIGTTLTSSGKKELPSGVFVRNKKVP